MTRRLTARALLDVWEQGLDQPAVVRPAVLAAAGAGRPVDEVLGWDVGRRDAALFDLRVQIGPTADAVSICPSCGAQLDVPLDLSLIGPDEVDTVPLTAGPYRVWHRLPTTADLLVLLAAPGQAAWHRAGAVRRRRPGGRDPRLLFLAFDDLAAGEQELVATAIA